MQKKAKATKGYKQHALTHPIWLRICMGLLIFVGLTAFTIVEQNKLDAGLSSFLWQLIGFTFVIATLLLTINFPTISKRQRALFGKTGFLLIFSGSLIIGGYGMIFMASSHPEKLVSKMLLWLGWIFILAAYGLFSSCLSIIGIIGFNQALGNLDEIE